MQTVPMIMKEGLAIAILDDRHWVIDTGAPFTLGEGTLAIDGRPVPLVRPFGGYSPAVLTQVTGVPIAGILGAAELFRDGCTLDAPGGCLTFGAPEAPGEGVPCSTRSIPGQRVPVLEARLEGHPVRVALDTGASVGYLRPGLVEGLGDPVDQAREFVAMTDSWHDTPLWHGRLEVDGQAGRFRWGMLPESCSHIFDLLGLDALFGGELLAQHTVSFAPGGQRCWVVPAQLGHA